VRKQTHGTTFTLPKDVPFLKQKLPFLFLCSFSGASSHTISFKEKGQSVVRTVKLRRKNATDPVFTKDDSFPSIPF